MSSRILVDEIYGKTANTSALTIDSGGYVELPNTTFLDIWHLTANEALVATNGYTTITGWSRWEGSMYNSQASWERMGTGMSYTDTGGVFSFPSTGKYEITFNAQFNGTAGAGAYFGVHINASDDGGTTFDRVTARWNPAAAASNYVHAEAKLWFDVTNITNNKVKFEAEVAANCNITGYTGNYLYTWASFQKLAGT